MDANKVWQWRIMCVDKYSRHPEPFHCSNRIGLDFNVASNNHQKLDIGLVTNGVILEVCDFAKTVNKSKRHFFTNILENNFNLDLENDQQRIDFTSRIMHKVKNLIRKPPKDKNEVFTLFDTPCNPECSSSNEPNMASTKHKTERILVETDDTDDWEHEEELQCSHATSKDCIKAESLLEEMDRAQSDDSDYEDEFKFSEAQSAEKQKDDDFSKLFPFCEKIGLNLDFGSKQSLEPGLLTKGIMLELIHFTRILTASYSPIVLDVLEHNFELDLKSQQEKSRALFKISHLLKKRTRFFNIGTKISPEFKTEPFSFQTNPFKRHRETALSDMEAPQYQFKEVTKRRQSDLKNKQAIKRRKRDMETNTLSYHTHLYSTRTAEGDHCHTCPVGKSDSDSKCDMEQEVMGTERNCSYPLGSSQLILDKATDSGNVCKQNQSQNPKCSLGYDVPRKPESNCLHVPFLNTNYIVSTLPTDNLNVIPPLATYSQNNEGGHCGVEEKCQTPINVPNKSDMEQEALLHTTDDISSSLPTVNSNANQTNEGGCCEVNAQTQTSKNTLNIGDLKQEEIETENSNANPPFANQPIEGWHCEVEEKIQTSRNILNNGDMKQEEMETENNMWKLRANRARKILSTFEFGPFHNSMKCLEFNIGFSAKKNIGIDNLRDSHLLEVAKFAIAMNSSKQDFIMEILEHNFDFGLQSEYQQNVFTLEIMNRVRELENCEDAIKFSNEVFELPVRPCMGNVKHQLSNIMKIECKFSPLLPLHSQANTSEHISQKSLDLYPFCQEIGLKLNVNNHQPKKLDIKKLSNGSITEVTNFAEKLCGTFEQTCLDILRHNFSFDFQSEDSDLARDILARIPFLVEKQNLSNCVILGKGTRKDSSMMVKLDCQSNQKVDACKADSLQTVMIDQQVGRSTDFGQQDELNLKLWKCRSNQIEQVLSVPHEEHCPLYSFSRCKKLGIDFNVRSGFKQNLDLELLTNGIMVELNTFSATLISAQKHFITEILEYNCDLDLRNELRRSAFTHQVWRKMNVSHLKKMDKDHRKKKLFELPDLMCLQNPTKYCPKCLQERRHKLFQDDSDRSHMHHLHPLTMADIISGDANCTEQRTARDQSSTFSGREETIMAKYPSCKEIGFILFLDKDKPTNKFDTNVLTNEIIHEVVRFTKKLCGTKNGIIKDVLEHNFNMGMQGRNFTPTIPYQTLTPDWFNKVYVIHQYASKRETTVKKRTFPLQTEKERADDYTCPLVESDLDSDEFTDSGNCGIQDNLNNPNNSLSLDIPGQLKSRCLVILAPLHTTDDISSSLPTVNSNANKTNEGGCCEVIAQTQTSKNTLNIGDMKREEMETENNMWKLRANRVRTILSTFVFSPFYNSVKCGLEFNVGFSAKKNISVDNLRDSHLLEVAKFAIAMNSSKQDFIMEILEHNFDFGLQSEYQRNIFTLEIMNRMRELENCEDAIKFSNEVFELPGRPGMGNVKPQLGNIMKIEECEFSPLLPPHSQANTSEHISQKSLELYPFCQEIGLKLNVYNPQQNKKLDIDKLSNGSMTEVTNFAERLCGKFAQICLDILKHNFCFDFQSGDSDLAGDILARIPFIVDKQNLSNCAIHITGKDTTKDSTTIVKLDCQRNPHLDACSDGSSQSVEIVRPVGRSPDFVQQDELHLKLWKCRANHIKQILSVPHEEHCPLYSFSRCQKLGIDFNVGSGIKQNLDPKLLTNGIMVEINTFAAAMLSAQKHFITEILEYNLNLDLKNELYRSAFTQQLWKKVIPMNVKRSKRRLMNTLFELPDLMCLPNPSKYCPKCFQERSHKLCQNDFDPSHIHHPRTHTTAGAVSDDANYTGQKTVRDRSSTFLGREETIMDSYRCCQKKRFYAVCRRTPTKI
ncbi:hypothetical protein KUCAC02_019631 [Chaenocephalus aceratus]|uniref:Uncharacterized protein n=1 Tax=Chaenocephalus aceratus TaxID=36190 RepID=A0ACB9VQ83_CHAAC|nr:hypothetical protein KUCAC02_019631 [Chaenocephalus aceratus]